MNVRRKNSEKSLEFTFKDTHHGVCDWENFLYGQN